jgi:hypothetical protein
MPDLAAFQNGFASALMADGEAGPSFQSQAFAVYRNTAARGAIEALRASYSTVDMLLGEEMFTQVALDYRREQPPAGPVLSDYGANFAEFLARQPWTCELPYLANVAWLDWLWLQSFLAGDANAMPHELAGGTSITLHPATRFAWLTTPAMTIWLAHRDPWEAGELDPEWQEEGALFTRVDQTVRAELIGADFHWMLLVCSVPTSVRDLASAVAAAFPAANVQELLQRGVASGALIIQ